MITSLFGFQPGLPRWVFPDFFALSVRLIWLPWDQWMADCISIFIILKHWSSQRRQGKVEILFMSLSRIKQIWKKFHNPQALQIRQFLGTFKIPLLSAPKWHAKWLNLFRQGTYTQILTEAGRKRSRLFTSVQKKCQIPEDLRILAPLQILHIQFQSAAKWRASCRDFFQPGSVRTFVWGGGGLRCYTVFTLATTSNQCWCRRSLFDRKIIQNNIYLKKTLNKILFWYMLWAKVFYFRSF